MKLACVIHRFAPDIAGGSEAHCRSIAQHLAEHHDVTILTSCARDHVSWANAYPAGESSDGRLRVVRFPVARTRNLLRFREISDQVFANRGTAADEAQWFRENGPEVPALLEYLEREGRGFDLVLFWSYRYYQSYFGLPLVADRSVLVPTAEADPLIYVETLRPFFARPAGYVFLTPEEVELLGERVPASTPSVVIGAGIDPPPAPSATAAPSPIEGPYVLYLGRVDPNKGCETLLRHYTQYAEHRGDRGRVPLVLAGPANMPIPQHPWIRHLGFVDVPTREALLAHARVLVMPSPFESLSMVLLEAWNHAVPALVNARCAVLKGQVARADGGLYYRSSAEFEVALDRLLDDDTLARRLGAQGRAYVDREYRWPTVIAKLEGLLNRIVH